MNWQKILFPILAGVVLVGAWQGYGWGGVALAGGAIVMYLMLHFNRLMHVIKKAADRPKGYVGSAVMLNGRKDEKPCKSSERYSGRDSCLESGRVIRQGWSIRWPSWRRRFR